MVKRLQVWFSTNTILYGSPLHHSSYALVTLSLLAVVLFLGLSQTVAYFAPFNFALYQVFWIALGLSILASLTTMIVLWYLDRRERESAWGYALAFLWGAAIATGLAMPINQRVIAAVTTLVTGSPALNQLVNGQPMLLAAPIAGPLVEELTKGLGVVVFFVLLRSEFDNMRDGFIYGALIGAGFNCLEVALYIVGGFAVTGTPAWGAQIGGRYALFGFASHALYTGMFGAALGWARQTRQRELRWIALIIGMLLALAAHALNNALPLIARFMQLTPYTDLDAAVLLDQPVVSAWLVRSWIALWFFWPFYLLILAGLWRSGVWERRVIGTELAQECSPIVTPDDHIRIQRDRVWRTRVVPHTDRQHSRALVNAQNELAFRKHRVRMEGCDPELDPMVHQWRERIVQLRAQATESRSDRRRISA